MREWALCALVCVAALYHPVNGVNVLPAAHHNAEFLWNQGLTGKGATIYLFDGALPAERQLLNIFERIPRTMSPSVDAPHATAMKPEWAAHSVFTTSLITGCHSCQGMAPDAKVVVYPITSMSAEAIDWDAIQLPEPPSDETHIACFPFGRSASATECQGNPTTERTALQRFIARHPRILVMASAGNDGPLPGTVNFPASEPGVLAVGASNRHRRPSAISSVGGGPLQSEDLPHLYAVGENVLGASLSGHGCHARTGTSTAAPIACGAMALLAPELRRAGIDSTDKLARLLSETQSSSSRVLELEVLLERLRETRRDRIVPCPGR